VQAERLPIRSGYSRGRLEPVSPILYIRHRCLNCPACLANRRCLLTSTRRPREWSFISSTCSRNRYSERARVYLKVAVLPLVRIEENEAVLEFLEFYKLKTFIL